jgi:long-chain acyl-CoA synthetase
MPARDDIPESTVQLKFSNVISIEEACGYKNLDLLTNILSSSNDFTVSESINRNSISSLVYTSGTTGPSKGVMQTHGNHLSNVEQATRSGVFGLDGSLFLFLPLAHSFARLIAYLGALTKVKVIYCGVPNQKKSLVDLALVAKEMATADAHIIPSVPRLFEKIKATLQSPKPGLAGLLLKVTLWSSMSKLNPIRLITSPIRKKIKSKIFGRKFTHAISGGAKLPKSVAEFFAHLDIKIFEGYGLTETCVATNVNLPARWKIGSVGPAFDKVEIKIAEDGEILFKGPNITKGYWNRPIATKDSWDTDGWFHTGDIGHLDNEGFLFITDRKKDLVITAGGKKIPPQRVESLLLADSLISHAVYFGDEKPFCIALVFLSAHQLNDQQLNSKLEQIKTKVNSQLASYENIKKLVVIPDELTIENGALTPTHKVKRKEVIKRYKDIIEEQYK